MDLRRWDGSRMFRWRNGGVKLCEPLKSARSRAIRYRRYHRRPDDCEDLLGQILVREPGAVQRLCQPSAARADLCAEWFGGRSADRARGDHRAGQRIRVIRSALKIAPVTKARWKSICEDCSGSIDSLVELLQGRFSKGVMERICRQNHGLFPSPAEIKLSCSCPDWAGMCKHVAAVLYGIGSRFDQQPELLFRLREVDEKDLIAKAGSGIPLAAQGRRRPKC